MSDVQARPSELTTFSTTGNTAADQLETDRDTLDNAFIAFRYAAGGSCAAQGDAIVGAAMTSLIAELREIPTWVTLVHDALVAADHPDGNGLVSVDAATFDAAFRAAAGQRGLNIENLAASNQITVATPQVGTIPPDSGYVNDPVCTATGHLLVDSRDFAMPARLDVLSFRRTYASESIEQSAFGPGWWTWTECRGVIGVDGSFNYVGPDGMQLIIAPADNGRGWFRPDLDISVERRDDRSQVLRWGRRSSNPNQHWTFRDGLLVEVAGPFIGATSLHHRSGRLVRLEHDSGRALELRWKGDRVAEITSSDGRRARFTYDRAGTLVAVDNARSAESYDVDDAGRILSITDADGVRTVAMAYDDDGRVDRADLGDRVHHALRLRRHPPDDVVRPATTTRCPSTPTTSAAGWRCTRPAADSASPDASTATDASSASATPTVAASPSSTARQAGCAARKCAGRPATWSATTTTTSTASSGSRRTRRRRRSAYDGDSMLPAADRGRR